MDSVDLGPIFQPDTPASNRSSDEVAAWGDFDGRNGETNSWIRLRTAKIEIKNSKRLSN
jgi:hypothetical protein